MARRCFKRQLFVRRDNVLGIAMLVSMAEDQEQAEDEFQAIVDGMTFGPEPTTCRRPHLLELSVMFPSSTNLRSDHARRARDHAARLRYQSLVHVPKPPVIIENQLAAHVGCTAICTGLDDAWTGPPARYASATAARRWNTTNRRRTIRCTRCRAPDVSHPSHRKKKRSKSASSQAVPLEGVNRSLLCKCSRTLDLRYVMRPRAKRHGSSFLHSTVVCRLERRSLARSITAAGTNKLTVPRRPSHQRLSADGFTSERPRRISTMPRCRSTTCLAWRLN